MIGFLSSWVKEIGIAIVVVSILEMLLPNNRTKKYIKMVLGVYVIFSIISPLIKNKAIFNADEFNLENYQTETTSAIDQTSMDERIKELYEKEIEKDIIKKLNEKGYELSTCKVTTQISNKEEETKINKIKIKLDKKKETKQENEEQEDNTENKIVTEIQKIKKVETKISSTNDDNNTKEKVSKTDIQNIKKFLIEEYGVNENCLEIN